MVMRTIYLEPEFEDFGGYDSYVGEAPAPSPAPAPAPAPAPFNPVGFDWTKGAQNIDGTIYEPIFGPGYVSGEATYEQGPLTQYVKYQESEKAIGNPYEIYDPAGNLIGYGQFTEDDIGGGGFFGDFFDLAKYATTELAPLAAFAFGAGPLGGMLGGAVTSSLGISASAATNALIGNTIMQTIITGGDIEAALKSSLASWAGAQVGDMVGSAAKNMFSNPEGIKFISNVANQATKSVVLGQDLETAVKNAFVVNAVDFATAKIPQFSSLPSGVQATIKQSINAAVQGQGVDAGTMLANAAKEGLLSYGLNQIPQFKDTDAKTQSFISTMLRAAIEEGDLSQTAVNWAIGQANQELQKVIKAGPALDELKKAGIISEASYYSLTDEQKMLVDSFASQSNPQAAAAKYVNEQTTTDAEIKEFYKQITGRDATDAEADLLKTFVGMDEASAKVGLDNQIRANIAADQLRFDELQKVFSDPKSTDQDFINKMAEFNITPAFVEKITGRKYDDIVRELDARFLTQDEVVEAYRSAREAAGLEPKDPTPDDILRYVGRDASVLPQIQKQVDEEATTFDGSSFGSITSAMEAAKAQGYNNFIGPDGKSYIVDSPAVSIQAGAFDGTTFGSIQSANDAAREAGKTNFVGPDGKTYVTQGATSGDTSTATGTTTSPSGVDVTVPYVPPAFTMLNIEHPNQQKAAQIILEELGDSFLNDPRWAKYLNEGGLSAAAANIFAGTEDSLRQRLRDFKAGNELNLEPPRDALQKQIDAGYDLGDYKAPAGFAVTKPSADSLITGYSAAGVPVNLAFEITGKSNIAPDAAVNALRFAEDIIANYGGTDETKQALTSALAVGASGLGEIGKLASDLVWASGLVDRNNVAGRTADAIKTWGESLQRSSGTTKVQEDNIIRAVESAKGVVDKSAAFFRAAKDNPLGAVTLVGKEAVQEIPLLIASGGAGRIVSGVAGKTIGFWAATGTNSVLNAGESFSANFGETYDNIKKAGGSEQYAKTQAFKAGSQAALIGFGSSLIGDSALVKSFMREASGITAGTFAKQAAKQYVTGWGEDFLQNASVQYNSFGKVDWDQAQTAGAIGGAINMGVASGILTPSAINYQLQVATDTFGRPVTLQQLMDGSAQVQPGSINQQAQIFNVNGVGVSLDQMSQATTATLTNPEFNIDNFFSTLNEMGNRGQISPNAANVALSYAANPDADFSGTSSDIGSFSGDQTGNKQAVVISVDDVFKTAVIGNQDGTKTIIDVSGKDVVPGSVVTVDPKTLSVVNVVSDSSSSAGAKQSVVIEVDNTFNTATVWNQDGSKTIVDTAGQTVVPGSIVGVNPTTSSIVNVVTTEQPTAGSTGTTTTTPSVDPSLIADLDLRLSSAIEAAKTAGMLGDAALQVGIDKVASDLGTTRQDLLTQMGATEQSLKTQFASQIGAVTTEVGNVESRLTQAINDAKATGVQGDAALDLAIQKVASDLGTSKEALLGQIGKTETQLRIDFAAELGGVRTELGLVESRLAKAIQDARAEGITGDAALQSAIDAVSLELGTSREALLGQIGKTETQLRTDFSTQLGAVTTELGNVEGRLNAAIDAAKASGLAGDAALDAAIQSVSAELGTTKEALLGQIGKTETQLRSDFATQLGAVTTELGNVESRLTTAIDAAKASGLAGDAALQSAIDAVATDLGTSREALLGQLGKTESQLRSDFSTQLGAVTEELSNVESRLSTAIEEAKASGLAGDAALQKAIDTVASDLGTTKDTLLDQLGKTEEALRTDFASELETVSTELGNVETRLKDAIAAAEASGMSRDEAIAASIDKVAADLGTTKEDLLSSIGKTEEALRSEFQTGLSDAESRLTTAIEAAIASGLKGDEALQSAINQVSSDLGTTKDDLLTQIGKTETQLRTDFSTQLGEVVTEIGNVETRLQDAIADAEARGLTRSEAIQSALDTVAADLGTTKADLLTQIGTTESTLRGEIEASQKTIEEQIVSTEQRVTDAIAAAEARGLTRDQAIQAGLDQVAADLGTTKADILSELGTTASTLRAEIEASQTALGKQITTGLEGLGTALSDAEARINERAAAYEAIGLSRDQALSTAIGDVAAQLGTTAADLQSKITQAQTSLGESIAGVKTDLQKQIDEAATLLGKPAQTVTQADLDYVTSVISGKVTTTPDLTYDVNRDGKIDQADFDYLSRVSAGGGEPPEFQAGTRWAPTGLFGEISGLRSDITAQLQQQELKRQQDAAKAKAEEEVARRRKAGLDILSQPSVASSAPAAAPTLSPLQTSGASKFISPLAGFLAAVETGNYLQPKPQQPTMTPQPQQAQTDRYSYGKEQSIDSLLDPYGEQSQQQQQSPFGFKAGGLAMGGGTRYGRFAGGGLNVVHHSGKARVDFREGDAVTGPGDGQSDDIPAMLADGEYVIDSEIVAALGNGSTKAGSELLDEFRRHIRSHKRGGSLDEIPPPSKSPLEYLAMAKKSVDKRASKK